jgi:hypothetical protein
MLSRTLELGRYVIALDQEQPFLAKRETMVEAAKENFPGLIDVMLAKLDDGSYVVELGSGRTGASATQRWRRPKPCRRSRTGCSTSAKTSAWSSGRSSKPTSADG